MSRKERIKKPFYKKWWFYLILFIVIGGVASTLLEEKPTQGGGNEIVDKDPPKDDPVIFKLNIPISYKDFDITIGNQREVSGITGKEYIIFDVEIVAKKDNFSFFGDFQGVTSDNEIVTDTYPMVSEDLGDSIMTVFTKKLDTNQKAKGYLAFDRKIVKLELTSSMFSNKKITIDLD